MDYQNGKIYRLDCNITGEVYIGSTTQPTVAKRLAQHKQCFKRWKNGKYGFTTSFPIIERNNYNITMIELYPCNSKDELASREGFYIRSMACVNKFIPSRTKEEYYQDHKQEILEQRKEYYQCNKDKISQQRKERYNQKLLENL